MATKQTYITNLDAKYPNADDCATLKLQIAAIEKEIVEVTKNKIKPNVDLSNLWNNNATTSLISSNNAVDIQIRLKTLEHLNKLLLQKKSNYDLSKCSASQQIIASPTTTTTQTPPSIETESGLSKNTIYGIAGVVGVIAIGITLFLTRKK